MRPHFRACAGLLWCKCVEFNSARGNSHYSRVLDHLIDGQHLLINTGSPSMLDDGARYFQSLVTTLIFFCEGSASILPNVSNIMSAISSLLESGAWWLSTQSMALKAQEISSSFDGSSSSVQALSGREAQPCSYGANRWYMFCRIESGS